LPRGRLGLEAFRNDIQPQLIQLISQAVVYPGFPAGSHRSYLVGNGYFEEEVQRAIDDLNRMPYPSKIELISRGNLLNWATELGTSIWPSELDDTQALLELFLSDPHDLLPVYKLSTLLGKVLTLDPTDAKELSKAEFHRAVTSAALLTGIATSRFAEKENHFSVVSAWTIFAVSTIAASDRHKIPLRDAALESLALAEAAISDSLTQLWNEIFSRKHLVEGNALADPEVYGWRYTTLLGLLSCLVLFDDEDRFLETESRSKLHQWLKQVHTETNLWGEGAVSNLVPWLVWLRKNDATLRPDYEIASLTKAVINRNQRKSTSSLPGPYFSFEDIARFGLKLDKVGEASALRGETLTGSSYTAEALLHLLVRTNLKQECEMIWPGFTKLSHRYCLQDQVWSYCTIHSKHGIDVTRIYPNTYTWAELKADATKSLAEFIPNELARRPWLLALWWQVVPYRYTTAASHVFTDSILSRWGR
jgi:hypothetical protein